MITINPPPRPSASAEPAALPGLCAGPALPATIFSAVRRRAALEGCKWDPQVGDVSSVAPFPLVMKRALWEHLAAQAERLAAESVAAEIEVARRPDLLAVLGLPRALRQVLLEETPLTPAAGCVTRFDFHPTTDGWRISEANSDVPGGYSEASDFTASMAEHFPALRPAGDPAAAWTGVLASAAGPGGVVALLSAPGYIEDHQVIAYLAARLRARGCQTHLASPQQLTWPAGYASLETAWYRGPVNVVVRFYQAEWVVRLPMKSGWRHFFRGGRTPVAGAPLAAISESKRFPLVWEGLATALPTWRALLPESRDPRDVPWVQDQAWLLKTALCNNGDTVNIRELLPASAWRKTRWQALLSPRKWVAQRRFDSVPLPTPLGLRHVCLGIYTVDGRAAGAYARLSENPVINFAAVDVALLIQHD